MNALERGGLAGLLATLPMTAVMAAADRAGLLRVPPPEQITATAAVKADLDDDLSRPAFQASWIAAHVGVGVTCGAAFVAVRPLLPSASIPAGLAFGLGVWAMNYVGLLPALGLYPPPRADRQSRTAVMIAAHACFGLALEASDRWMRGRRGSAASS